MKQEKTWLQVFFYEGDANIELTINYKTGKFTIEHGNNDQNVTFNGNSNDGFKLHFDRLKCVSAALKFAQQELPQTETTEK